MDYAKAEGVSLHPTAEGQARLAVVRAHASVASATTALDANLAAVSAAMTSTLGSPSNH